MPLPGGFLGCTAVVQVVAAVSVEGPVRQRLWRQSRLGLRIGGRFSAGPVWLGKDYQLQRQAWLGLGLSPANLEPWCSSSWPRLVPSRRPHGRLPPAGLLVIAFPGGSGTASLHHQAHRLQGLSSLPIELIDLAIA